jgi:aspartate racemase
MSWPSTITYYRKINEAVQAQLGGVHSARLVIWSDDYHNVERMQLSGDWDAAGEWLADSAQRLAIAGADVLGIACNTMHKVVAAISRRTTLPIVDMIEVAAVAAAARGCSKTAILGTRFTLEMGKYSYELAARGVEPFLPSPADIELIDRIIHDELCLGRASEEARAVIKQVVARLAAERVDSVMLACTELNLILGEQRIGEVLILDAAQLHVDALVTASLERS